MGVVRRGRWLAHRAGVERNQEIVPVLDGLLFDLAPRIIWREQATADALGHRVIEHQGIRLSQIRVIELDVVAVPLFIIEQRPLMSFCFNVTERLDAKRNKFEAKIFGVRVFCPLNILQKLRRHAKNSRDIQNC